MFKSEIKVEVREELKGFLVVREGYRTPVLHSRTLEWVGWRDVTSSSHVPSAYFKDYTKAVEVAKKYVEIKSKPVTIIKG